MLDLKIFLRNRVFPHLSDKDIDKLLSCLKTHLLKPREKLTGEMLYIVYSGRVRDDSGEEIRVAEYKIAKTVTAIEESIILTAPLDCVKDIRLEPELDVREYCRIGDLVKGEPVTVTPETKTIDAVKIMANNNVSSVVVVHDGRPIGIFTDTDLRRLVASKANLEEPIVKYMSKRLVTITPEASCLEAVYRMMLHGIKHIIITDSSGKLHGVVTVRDIAYVYGPYHLYYLRRIRTASLDEVAKLYKEFTSRVRREASRFLEPEEVPDPITIIRMTTLVYHAILGRIAEIVSKKHGVEPSKFSYIVLGSGGRFEQFLVTDRDTMLVYDQISESTARKLAEDIEDSLDRIGFPGCEKNYTSRNLLYSLGELVDVIRRLGESIGSNDALIKLSLMFDAYAVYGREDFARSVRRLIAAYTSRSKRVVVSLMTVFKPPLGAFGRLLSRFNIKVRGLAPIVMTIKALAMAESIVEPTHTLDRLAALVEKHVIPRDLGIDIKQAYIALQRYSIWLQASHGKREVIVSELTGGETLMLKSIFKSVARLIDYVTTRYG